MNCNRSDVEWLEQNELQGELHGSSISREWFPAFLERKGSSERVTYCSALAPVDNSGVFLTKGDWGCDPTNCAPNIWTIYQGQNEEKEKVYLRFGNDQGIEPLVHERIFHGMQKKYFEISEEFRLFHNLWAQPDGSGYLVYDDNGGESEAIKITANTVMIRRDLLVRFCAAKQMALLFFVESTRFSASDLQQLSASEVRESRSGDGYRYDYYLVNCGSELGPDRKSMGRVIGKKAILPKPLPDKNDRKAQEHYQEFIVGIDDEGNEIKNACGPGLETPDYLTPVFFNREVLNKYFGNPQKYYVQDGHLWCGSLWSISIDNDHDDYVVVFLGDLGRDLNEKERHHWLGYNTPPHGRTLSKSQFRRSFMAEWSEAESVALVFKRKYLEFNCEFVKQRGWYFFSPLHADDEHCLKSLRLPGNNIVEFEEALKWLVKLLVDSLNEKALSSYINNLEKGDKGITKAQKFFERLNVEGFQKHIEFLRTIQDLRNKAIAHRKGSSYEKIKKSLNLRDDTCRSVFKEFLASAVLFIEYLEKKLLGDGSPLQGPPS